MGTDGQAYLRGFDARFQVQMDRGGGEGSKRECYVEARECYV